MRQPAGFPRVGWGSRWACRLLDAASNPHFPSPKWCAIVLGGHPYVNKQSASDESRFGRDLTTGSVPRHLVAFALPMLAGNVIHTAYSLVNAVWVGKGLGKLELAAVTVSFPVVFVLVALAGGLTMASGILVAQYAGARNYPRLRGVVNTSTALIGLISLFLLPVGEVLTPWILHAMRTGPDVYPLAAGYMRIFLLTIPPNFGIFLVMSALRGVGDSKTPLYFQGAGLLLTAILDPILMFGWLGAPRLGLNGTAVAAVAMQTLSLVALYVYLHRKEHVVAPEWHRLRIDRETAWLIVKLGFPSALQQSFISLGMLVVTG
ncbi:MAG: MATE family efflux transporter, partial [Armatimonadota bacterium]|nr:MATE family efflux transporter [Armatimonadota bacterium]